MLTQSFVLAFLSALAIALPLFAVSGDLLLSVRVGAFPAALALAFGAVGQVSITRHHVQGRIDRARYQPAPWRPIIDQPAPLPEPKPEIPAVKPLEIVRLVPVISHASQSQTSVFASDGRPLFPTARLIDGVPEADLKHFLELIPTKGHQRRKWLGVLMPSGKKVDGDYYKELIAPLVKARVIVGRSEGVAGEVTCSPQTAKERLQLAP